MQDRDWIPAYQKLLLAGQEKQASELKRKNFPTSLYRFMRLNEYSIASVKNATFWLASIDSLNDPYESSLLFRKGDYFRSILCSNSFIESFHKNYNWQLSDAEINKVLESTDPYQTFREVCRSHGWVVGATEQEFYKDENENDWKKNVATVRQISKICSFTERFDSVLMWSHYAEQHKGICVEYDFLNSKDWDYLEPVYYSDKLFNLSARNSLNTNQLLAASTKSKDWEYEKEWRVIATTREPMTYVKGPVPKTVLIGTRYTENDSTFQYGLEKEVKKQGIPIKQVKLHPTEYRMMIDESNP